MAIQVTYRRTRMPKKEVERFIEEHREWIAKARKKTYESQKRRADFYNKLPLKTREQADDAQQRSRWGVCNVKDKSICFSAYLLLLPEWCVEHVVVHELCHLLEPSHNARFHTLMDKFFPRWKEARKTTRQICKMEEDEEE